MNNSEIIDTFFNNKIETWDWLFNSANCILPNNKLIYYLYDSLYCIDKKYKPTINKNLIAIKNTLLQCVQFDSLYALNLGNLAIYNYKTNKLIKLGLHHWPTFGEPLQAIASSNLKNNFYAVIGNSLKQLNIYTKKTTELVKGINGQVRSIDVDTALNIIFVSTKDSGCYYFYNKQLNKLPFTFNNYKLNAHYIIKDNDGDYWLPTNFGLFFLKSNQLLEFLKNNKTPINFIKFGVEQGIENEEFNGGFQNSGMYFKDSLYLANMNGTIIFSPKVKNEVHKKTSYLVIDYIQTDSGFYYNNKSNLKLSQSFEFIKIKIALTNTSSENSVNYKILGSRDTMWNSAEDGIINIQYLNAGKYVLVAKASNSKSNIVTFSFTILPYWYNTWWAYTIFSGLILLGIYIVIMWRWQTLKNKALEAEEAGRNKLLAIISHDLKSPVNNFINLADNINFLLKQKDYESINDIGNEIDEKSRNLDLLMNNVFAWGNLKDGLVKNKIELINWKKILNDYLPIYADIASHKNIELNVNINTSLIQNNNPFIIGLLLRNAIDNAIKNSPNNSTIFIKIIDENKTTHVSISNKIINYNEDIFKEIDSFLNKKLKANPYNKNFGFGIPLIHEYSKLIKAKTTINYSSINFTLNFYFKL